MNTRPDLTFTELFKTYGLDDWLTGFITLALMVAVPVVLMRLVSNPLVIKFLDYQNWFWLVLNTAVASVFIILFGQALEYYLGEEQ